MDKLAGMAMFVRVVERGSFTAAAEISGVSPTMVGKIIRGLEDRLGARLLHRSTRRQHLTEVGALYYERCRQALAEVALADAAAADLRGQPCGLVRMVAPVGYGSACLTPVLADYLHLYPEVRVDLTLDNGRPDLLGGGHEVGIQIGDVFDETLVARPLPSYRRVLAASPDYIVRHGLPETPEALEAHSCLGLSYWRRRDIWRLEGPGGEQREVALQGRFTANQGEALRQAALHGLGIVLQPEALLAEDLSSGRLVRVLPGWTYLPTPVFLVYAQDARPTAKLRSLVDFLLSRLSADGDSRWAE